MIRGEVWWAKTPNETRRPVLVLTRDSVLPFLNAAVVAPITSTIRGIPTEVALDREDGMPKPCVVALDQIRTVPKTHLVRRITSLGVIRMEQVCEALRIAVAC
jgi:mRNA interferase MazF